jgi:hypothetical protein
MKTDAVLQRYRQMRNGDAETKEDFERYIHNPYGNCFYCPSGYTVVGPQEPYVWVVAVRRGLNRKTCISDDFVPIGRVVTMVNVAVGERVEGTVLYCRSIPFLFAMDLAYRVV